MLIRRFRLVTIDSKALLCVTLAMVSLIASNQLIAQDFERNVKMAFLVGVSKYEKDGLRDLDFAERDVVELKNELLKQGFAVTMLLGSGIGTERADLKNIRLQWAEFTKDFKGLNRVDITLVAFSGQGRQITVQREGTQVDDLFYCPVDAVGTQPETLWSLNSMINDVGDNSGSYHNLFLIDSCRLSQGRGKGLNGSTVQLKSKFGLLLACEADKESYEYDDLRHGLFTYYVLKGLRGEPAARNARGLVTWDSLTSYVKSEVIGESERRKRPQFPIKLENLPGRSPVLATKFE